MDKLITEMGLQILLALAFSSFLYHMSDGFTAVFVPLGTSFLYVMLFMDTRSFFPELFATTPPTDPEPIIGDLGNYFYRLLYNTLEGMASSGLIYLLISYIL